MSLRSICSLYKPNVCVFGVTGDRYQCGEMRCCPGDVGADQTFKRLIVDGVMVEQVNDAVLINVLLEHNLPSNATTSWVGSHFQYGGRAKKSGAKEIGPLPGIRFCMASKRGRGFLSRSSSPNSSQHFC